MLELIPFATAFGVMAYFIVSIVRHMIITDDYEIAMVPVILGFIAFVLLLVSMESGSILIATGVYTTATALTFFLAYLLKKVGFAPIRTVKKIARWYERRTKFSDVNTFVNQTKWFSVGKQLREVVFEMLPKLQETKNNLDTALTDIQRTLSRHQYTSDESGSLDYLRDGLVARQEKLQAQVNEVNGLISRCNAFVDLVRATLETAEAGTKEPADLGDKFELLAKSAVEACESVRVAEAEVEEALAAAGSEIDEAIVAPAASERGIAITRARARIAG